MAILTTLILSTKSMEYLSISLYHLQFPLLLFYNFQSMILPPWLSLFLDVYLVWCDFKWDFFFFCFFSDSLLFVCRKATDFCISILYLTSNCTGFISSNNFWWGFQSFLYEVSCHRQIVTFLLFLSNGRFLFLFLVWFLWLEFSIVS